MSNYEPAICDFLPDFIILKLLHFLIYENEIAIFGSAKALAAIAVIPMFRWDQVYAIC